MIKTEISKEKKTKQKMQPKEITVKNENGVPNGVRAENCYGKLHICDRKTYETKTNRGFEMVTTLFLIL